MDLLLHFKVIKSLEYLHKFSNCILILLCRLLTYSKLPLASHQTSACTYWTQPAGGLLFVIEWGETTAGKVLADGCALVVARTHPRNTHNKPHPQANSRLASVMAASVSWGASQNISPNQWVQSLFKGVGFCQWIPLSTSPESDEVVDTIFISVSSMKEVSFASQCYLKPVLAQ
jgi:hypothetical protein